LRRGFFVGGEEVEALEVEVEGRARLTGEGGKVVAEDEEGTGVGSSREAERVVGMTV
jgi:hypothetical protein